MRGRIHGRIWGTLDPFYEAGPAMGRSAANAEFLRFLLARDPFDEYHFFMPDKGTSAALAAVLAERHPGLWNGGDGGTGRRLRVAERTRLPSWLAEREYHVFHLSDCINHPASLARLRNARSRRIFPITGPTHSLSYVRYGRDFLAQLWAGCTARDAVVATSAAGEAAVGEWLALARRGYGLGEEFPGPRVARIPLGTDTEALRPVAEAERGECRLRLGLPQGSTVALAFGRISHLSKMDLLPLLRAFQRLLAEGLELAAVHLAVAGWTQEGDDYPEALAALARNMGLPMTIFPRPGVEDKRLLFGAADFFVSVADNPQETFGLSLLEAGAAGLAVVASDYDGYRDIVVPGATGLLVSTTGPGGTGDVDLLAPLLFDSQYHLMLSQRTAVDVPELAAAMGALIRDQGLAERLGRAGRERVESHFAWPLVIERYLRLWEELNAAPVDTACLGARHPLEAEFGRIFGGYPTRSLDPGQRLRWSRAGEAVYRGREHPVLYAGIDELVRPAAVRRLLFLARGGVAAGDLAARLLAAGGRDEGLDRDGAWTTIMWCLKHDLLERE